MMCDFEKGNSDGKGKAACIIGVVERRCEKSSYVGKRKVFRASSGQEAWSYAGRGRAEGDEIGDSISVNQAESSVVSRNCRCLRNAVHALITGACRAASFTFER
jgi:hypothetical protein